MRMREEKGREGGREKGCEVHFENTSDFLL